MFTGTSSSKQFAAMQFSFQLAPQKRAFYRTQGVLPHAPGLGCPLSGIHVACDPQADPRKGPGRGFGRWEQMGSIPRAGDGFK